MQSNVNPGPILRRTAGADLTGKTNHIVMLDATGKVVLHTAVLRQPYVLLEEAVNGEEVSIQALAGAGVRVKCAVALTPAVPAYLDAATGKATGVASAWRLGFPEEVKLIGEGDILIRANLQYTAP